MASKSGKSDLPSFINRGIDARSLERKASPFISIKGGESMLIAPVESIEGVISFEQHAIWLDAGNSPMFPCLKSDDCPGCMLNDKPRFRALMLVSVDGHDEQKILSMGKELFRQLIEIDVAMSPEGIKGKVMRYSRTGSTMNDTKYRIVANGKSIEEQAPTLNLVEQIGPLDRDGIIGVLEEAGIWPPKRSKPRKGEDAEAASPWDDDFEDE